MTAAEAKAHRALLSDLLGILRRNGSVLQRFQAVEDRIFQAQREVEAERMDCTCGEADCKSSGGTPEAA